MIPAINEIQLLFSTNPQNALGVPELTAASFREQNPSRSHTSGALAQVLDGEKGKLQICPFTLLQMLKIKKQDKYFK